ncbi:MAG: hypothetical protein A2452_00120 [Candidatus Firestonebacteria bacterium RIFOXYC2_FULL_39_67]|nr:MAG: hypothetical protein A2536_07185 [Candidatus Firestonebacteria bacterium RIFOXYD2_FULL_39_29]OGF53177.1 MAG: hypothetical protein A2497_07305 [Candidatus Firestonebacteria bacterium RifOxyC12_full_39_7]OGF55578.1 MAG: hypothetical protein A2452_00120 [Candidatus Firestonebacteria bacterium RIFOXYC2_FULL_39_67]
MEILKTKINKEHLKLNYAGVFKTMVKGVADIKNEIIALDAEMHADLETLLIEEGSAQEDLWGFNLYFERESGEFIEYTSLINIRPHQNNKSMEICNEEIKNMVKKTVMRWIG